MTAEKPQEDRDRLATVATRRDELTGELTGWVVVPRETADQWDQARWRPRP